MKQVVIFHTSDLHNKLTPQKAAKLKDLKSSHSNSLLFDSGDAVGSGNIFWRPGGEAAMDIMNQAGYDAMCMGNREFHLLAVGLNAKTRRADFPILSSNLKSTNKSIIMDSYSYTKFNINNIKIGVIGFSVPCVTDKMKIKQIADYYFIQPIEAASEIVPKIRKECDILIALTHIGIQKDRELAQKIPGIDIILGGHTHTNTEPFEKVNDTYILHHGAHAKNVGMVEISFENGIVKLDNSLLSF